MDGSMRKRIFSAGFAATQDYANLMNNLSHYDITT